MILQEMNYDYEIAGFVLRTEGPAADLGGIEGFGVFRTSTAKKPDITLRTGVAIAGPDDLSDLEFLHSQEFEGIECTLYRRGGDTYFFRMSSPEYGTVSFLHAAGSSVFDCDAGTDGKRPAPIIMRFLVWTAFGMAAVRGGGCPIHSSTIVCEGRAVLFLGESGTGKSTHTRLWIKNIPNAELLNDDSPVLRIEDGRAVVYGSPWSGKTPCYKTASAPLAACVRLSQAPHNEIRRLPKIEAFGALFPSCPPSFAADERLTDCICDILSHVIASVPIYSMKCLPDEDAALLVHKTVFG